MRKLSEGHQQPTASWVSGMGDDGFEYMLHLQNPAFVCKVGSADEGLLSGLSFVTSAGDTFHDLLWFDEPETGAQLEALLEQASEALAHL